MRLMDLIESIDINTLENALKNWAGAEKSLEEIKRTGTISQINAAEAELLRLKRRAENMAAHLKIPHTEEHKIQELWQQYRNEKYLDHKARIAAVLKRNQNYGNIE